MIRTVGQKLLAPLCLVLLLLVTACAQAPTSQFDQAQQESVSQKRGESTAGAIAGSNFNKFFPSPEEGYDRVYTQEKQGFAEAKLKHEDKDVAMMSISDTAGNPTAAEKYQASTMAIAGYPAVEQGTTATGVLVADRFQVKVLSRDPEFTADDRATWIEKFDLAGLAGLAELKP